MTHYIPVIRGTHMDPRLFDLLTQATPHGHEHLLYPILPAGGIKDEKGNMYYVRGTKAERKIIFSSHLDTVHTTPMKLRLRNVVEENGVVTDLISATTEDMKPCVLGADDKVGVYIMLRMMEANIPGLYIFHVGEERGCLGSKWIVNQSGSFFDEIKNRFKAVVAFDRKGYDDVITHQSPGRTCSDEFARGICTQLNRVLPPKKLMKPSNLGSYTDSATYCRDIPECTNISVGYFSQHTDKEHFDMYWLEKFLIPAVLQTEWNNLPIKRDPKALTNYQNKWKYSSNTSLVKKSSTPSSSTPWRSINLSTDWKNMPNYNMTDGLPEGATKWAIKAVLQKKFAMRGLDHFLDEVYNVIEELEMLKEENKQLIHELEKEKRNVEELSNPYWYN